MSWWRVFDRSSKANNKRHIYVFTRPFSDTQWYTHAFIRQELFFFFFFLNGGAWTIARRLQYQQMWCFYVFYRKSGLGIGCCAEKKFWQEQKMQTFLRLRALNVLCLSPFWHQRDFSPFFGGETSAHSPSEMLKRVMWWVERWLQVKCGTDRARVYRNKNSRFFYH